MELMQTVKIKSQQITNQKAKVKKLECGTEIREIFLRGWFVHLLIVGVSLERQ